MRVADVKDSGAYASLEDLIRIEFQARDFSFLPRQPLTSVLSGRYASRLRGRGLNFEELRRYQRGDDIRTMDWKVTARTRTPHVRVYTEEKDRSVLLVVDQRINMFFGTRTRFKSVTAAQLAALAAWRAVSAGDRIGAVLFNDTSLVEFRAQRSRKTVMSILGGVVEMNHALRASSQVKPRPDMLDRALERTLRRAPHDTLIVVISDFLGAQEETEQLTAQLTAHNDVLGLLVHDPTRLQPPSQRLTVSDGYQQMEVRFSNPNLRDKLVDDYWAEQTLLTQHLRRLSAPLLPVSNEGDVVEQVRRLLGVPTRAR